MIKQLGTFDIDNYGDLLYPIIVRHLLKKRDAGLQVHHYSPTAGVAPLEAGFETHSLESLFATSTDPCTFVIGGGDILRTDWDVVATHYGTNSRLSYDGLRRSIGTLNGWRYLLSRRMPRSNPAAFYAGRFRARWLDYPAAGPFLIDTANLPAGSSVAYLSCGVPREFKSIERSAIKRIFDQARFIYLRDEQSAEKLERAGVEQDIHVAPDLALTLSDQFDQQGLVRRGKEIVARAGFDPGHPFLCFQCQPYPGFAVDEIVTQLRRYRERTASQVVLLATGYCHGDREFLQSLARRSGGALKCAPAASVADIMATIAASDLFIGTSLHGNITALSFGVPHLLGPLPVAKADGFLEVMKLPPDLKLDAWAELNNRIDQALGLGRAYFSERAHEGKQRVYQVVDKLLHDCLN
jgi:hypothetical protein